MDLNLSELLEAGKNCFEKRDFLNARKYLETFAEKNERYADVHNMLGMIYHEEGRFGEAISSFERALKLNPRYTEASLNLAVTYSDLGEYKKAKEAYGQAKSFTTVPIGQLDPVVRAKLANMHAKIADLYHSLGRYKDAASQYGEALKLAPTFVDIQTKLGTSLREDSKYQDAIEVLKKAVKSRASYIPARIQLGIALYSAKKVKEAIKEWETVLDGDPNNKSAAMYLRLAKSSEEKPASTATNPTKKPAKKTKASGKKKKSGKR